MSEGQRNLRSSPTRAFNSSALIISASVTMPQDNHAQTAAKRDKCDSRKPFATAPTRRHLAGLAVHTARVSGEPWLRTPLSVRISSVATSPQTRRCRSAASRKLGTHRREVIFGRPARFGTTEVRQVYCEPTFPSSLGNAEVVLLQSDARPQKQRVSRDHIC
jgi:hypothetical protein